MFAKLLCHHDFHLVGHRGWWEWDSPVSITSQSKVGHKFDLLCFLCGKVKKHKVRVVMEEKDVLNYAMMRGWLK